MSVQNESYVILGVRLDFNKTSQFLEDNYCKTDHLEFPRGGKGAIGKLGILFDGMNGQYAIAGKCLKVESPEYNEYFDCFDLGPYVFGKEVLEKEVLTWLYENKLDLLVSGAVKCSFFVIGHYH